MQILLIIIIIIMTMSVHPRDVPDPWRSSRDGSRQEDEQICYT